MKHLFILLLLLFPFGNVNAQDFEDIDYNKYCGTWKYENADTTFIISLKKINRYNLISERSIMLVGGYRLTVKGKFDDNYLDISKIPDNIYKKKNQHVDKSNGIYLWGFVGYDENGLEMNIYDMRANRTDPNMPGMIMQILPDGTMKWYLDKKMAAHTMRFYEESPEYEVSVPTYAIMKKVE